MTMGHTRKGLFAIVTALALWCGMLVCLEIGRRIGIAHLRAWGPDALSGAGAVAGIVFSLLAFLLGFAFNGAAKRFDRRRELVINLASSIGTSWRRIDVLTPERQTPIRPLFLRYVDALLAWYAGGADVDPLRAPAAVTDVQDAIWSRAVAACRGRENGLALRLLLPSLGETFGAVGRERMARRIHPPRLIAVMLAVTELAAALFAGYAMANTPGHNWLYIIGVTMSVAVTTFVIIDLEYPRLGFVRIDAMHQELLDLRKTFITHDMVDDPDAASDEEAREPAAAD